MPPKTDCLIKFLSDFDCFESKCQLGIDVAKGYFLNHIFYGLESIKLRPSLLKALSDFENNNDIVVTRVDKRGKIVIMDSIEYQRKLMKFYPIIVLTVFVSISL